MDNLKFNFLWRGRLESLNLDIIFLPLFKVLPCSEVFFGNLIFAIIARMLCGNHLNLHWQYKFMRYIVEKTYYFSYIRLYWTQCQVVMKPCRLKQIVFFLRRLSYFNVQKNKLKHPFSANNRLYRPYYEATSFPGLFSSAEKSPGNEVEYEVNVEPCC